MNTERDKFLTLAIGECWHSLNEYARCSGCGRQFTIVRRGHHVNNNFSTPDGFFKLWDWAKKQEWWSVFEGRVTVFFGGMAAVISQDRFASAVYEFLKSNGE